MSDELLPCPWCGETPVFEPRDPKLFHRVHCVVKTCPVNPQGQLMVTRDGAIAAWNTRAAKPAVKLPQCYEIADNIVMSGGTVLTPKRDGRLLMTADVIAMLKLAGIDIQPLPEGPRS